MTAAAPRLLDPAFLQELEALKRRLLLRTARGGLGDRTTSRRGSSAEFQEHRAYNPGDDHKRIDWLATARSGQPVLKLFRAEENVTLRLLFDASASLALGTPTKQASAQRIAAAVGYLALANGQRTKLLVTRVLSDSHAAKLLIPYPSRGGRGGTASFFSDLQAIECRGGTNLSRAITQAVMEARRPGVLVVVSDFLDGGPVTHALGRAVAAGHDVALIQVLARDEIEPALEGDVSLVDSETGSAVDVSIDQGALDAYVLRVTGLVEELRAWSRRHGASYLRATTDEPLLNVVRRFVARSVD